MAITNDARTRSVNGASNATPGQKPGAAEQPAKTEGATPTAPLTAATTATTASTQVSDVYGGQAAGSVNATFAPALLGGGVNRPDLLADLHVHQVLEAYLRRASPPPGQISTQNVNLVGVVNKVNGLLTAKPPISPSMGIALNSFLTKLADGLNKGPAGSVNVKEALDQAAETLRAPGDQAIKDPQVGAVKVAPTSTKAPTLQLANFLLDDGPGTVRDLKDIGKPLDAANTALMSAMSTVFNALPAPKPMTITIPVAMNFTDPKSGLKIEVSKGAKLSQDAEGTYTLQPPDLRLGYGTGLLESQNAKLILGKEKDFLELGKGFVALPDGKGKAEVTTFSLGATAAGDTSLSAGGVVIDLVGQKVTGTGLAITRSASTDTTAIAANGLQVDAGGTRASTEGASLGVQGGTISGAAGKTSVTTASGLALKADSFQINLQPGVEGRGRLQATNLSMTDAASGLSLNAATAGVSLSQTGSGSSIAISLDGPNAAAGAKLGRGTIQGTGPMALTLNTNPSGVITNWAVTGSQIRFRDARNDFDLRSTGGSGAPRPVRLAGTSTPDGKLDSLQAEAFDMRWKAGNLTTQSTDATLSFTNLSGTPTARLRAKQFDVATGSNRVAATSKDLDATISMDAAGMTTGLSISGRDGQLAGPFGSLSSTGTFQLNSKFDNGLMSSVRLSTDANSKSTWASGARGAEVTGLDLGMHTSAAGSSVGVGAVKLDGSDGTGNTLKADALKGTISTGANGKLASVSGQIGTVGVGTESGAKLTGNGLALDWSPTALTATALSGEIKTPDGIGLSGKTLAITSSYGAGAPTTISATAGEGSLTGQGWTGTGQQLALQGIQKPEGSTWSASGKRVQVGGALSNGSAVNLELGDASFVQSRVGDAMQTQVRVGGSNLKVNGVSIELPPGTGAQASTLAISSNGQSISSLDLSVPGQVKAKVDDRGSLVLEGISGSAGQVAGTSSLRLGVAAGQVTAKLNTNGTAGIGFSGLAAGEQVGPNGQVQFFVGAKDLDASLVDSLKGKLGITATGAEVSFSADQVLSARAGITKLSIEKGNLTVKGVAADGRPTDVRVSIGADGKLQSAEATLSGDLQIVKGDLDLTVASGSSAAIKRGTDGSVEVSAQNLGFKGNKGNLKLSGDISDANVLLNANGDVVVKNFKGALNVGSGSGDVKLNVASLRNAMASYHMGNLVNDNTYLVIRPVTNSDGSIHLTGSVNMSEGPLKAKIEFHDLKQLEAMATVAPNELTVLVGDRSTSNPGWVKMSALGKALTAEGSYVEAQLTYSPMRFSRLNDALLRMADQKDVQTVTPWLSVDPAGVKGSIHTPASSSVIADLTVMLGANRGVYVPDAKGDESGGGVMLKLGARLGETKSTEVAAFAGLLPASNFNFKVNHGQVNVAGVGVRNVTGPGTAVLGFEGKRDDTSVQIGVFQNLARLTKGPVFIRENYANGVFGNVSTGLGRGANLTVTGSAARGSDGKLGFGVAGVLKVEF